MDFGWPFRLGPRHRGDDDRKSSLRPDLEAHARMSAYRDRIARRRVHGRMAVKLTPDAGWRNPEPAGPYDLVVIGAGPAGLAAAETAVEQGAKVALVERHRLGGASLWTGSVPSKAIIRTARLYAD